MAIDGWPSRSIRRLVWRKRYSCHPSRGNGDVLENGKYKELPCVMEHQQHSHFSQSILHPLFSQVSGYTIQPLLRNYLHSFPIERLQDSSFLFHDAVYLLCRFAGNFDDCPVKCPAARGFSRWPYSTLPWCFRKSVCPRWANPGNSKLKLRRPSSWRLLLGWNNGEAQHHGDCPCRRDWLKEAPERLPRRRRHPSPSGEPNLAGHQVIWPLVQSLPGKLWSHSH